MRLSDNAAHGLDELGPHAQVFHLGDPRTVVEDAHHQFFAGLRSRSRDAEVERPALELRTERAVLGLSLLGDVHRRQDFEHVDNGVAGGPVERLGGVQNSVDAVAHRKLLGRRLEVNVGGAPQNRVIDQFLAGHVRARLLSLAYPRRVFLAGDRALAHERDRRAGAIDRPHVAVEDRPHPQFVEHVVGNFAEVIRREHLLVVGHGLVAGVDVGEERHEIGQQQQA